MRTFRKCFCCWTLAALFAMPVSAGAADPVATTPDARHDGAAAWSNAGSALADAGDVNGDGLHDAIVAAPNADPNGRTDAGSVYVVLGRRPAATGAVTLGAGAIRIDGAAAYDRLGHAVAGAGDVNGDGLGDVLVTSRDADPAGRSSAGAAYVVFGRRDAATVDLAGLGGAGFRIEGAARNDRFGSGASAAGDQNGDGLGDVALGARSSDHNGRSNSGSTYVIFGKADAATVSAGALGAGGYRIDGALAGDATSAVASLGDLDGDGRSELLVGSSGADPGGRNAAGSVFVVRGQSSAATVDLASQASWLQRVNGAAANDNLGAAVAHGGDLDDDGRLDLVTGAPGADPSGRSNAGSVYVLDAEATGAVEAPAGGKRIDGPGSGDGLGTALAAARDLNGDGIADLALGNGFDDRNGRYRSGATYVLYGGSRASVTSLAGPLAGGFRVDGSAYDERAGAAVALAGDMSGDGRPELLHGVARFDAPGNRWDAGTAWVVHGFGQAKLAYPDVIEATVTRAFGPVAPSTLERTGSARFSVSPPLPPGVTLDPATGVVSGTPSQLYDGSEHTIAMTDLSGSVESRITLRVDPLPGACANERQGSDGDDHVTGSRGGDKITTGGGADVVDGAAGDDCLLGETGDDNLAAGAGTDFVSGAEGMDSLAGEGGDDRLYGEHETDVLDGGDGADFVDGGERRDELIGGSGDDRLVGGEGDDDLDAGEGDDELRAGIGQDALLGGPGVDRLLGEDGNDKLDGGAGDDWLFGGERADELSGGEGNDHLAGEAGWDVLVGNAGDDLLDGGGSDDSLNGGAGSDVLRGGAGHDYVVDHSGAGKVVAGSGNDTIEVRNRKRDVVRCGKGRDKVLADRRDRLAGCERKRRR